MPMTSEQRSLRSRLGAYTVHSRGLTDTEPTRAAFMARFEREVDPESKLSSAKGQSEPRRLGRPTLTRLAFRSFRSLSR